MTTENAENQTPSAGEEPQIPKYRLDQLAGEIRNLREAMQIKDQTIEQLRGQMVPQQRVDQEEEELLQSLDQNQLRAVNKLIDKRLSVGEERVRGVIGVMGNQLDEQKFLVKYGREKEKLLPRIREMRKEQANRGIHLDSEAAYKFILVEEMEAKAANQMSGKADPTPAPAAPAAKERKEDPPSPPPQAIRADSGKQSKSLEEMEADLDEQIKASGRTI